MGESLPADARESGPLCSRYSPDPYPGANLRAGRESGGNSA